MYVPKFRLPTNLENDPETINQSNIIFGELHFVSEEYALMERDMGQSIALLNIQRPMSLNRGLQHQNPTFLFKCFKGC